MKRLLLRITRGGLLALSCAVAMLHGQAAEHPFVGYWALTIPNGGAGWLGITETNGRLQASILWGGGSVVPVTSAEVQGDTLVLTRVYTSKRKDASGQAVVTKEVETIRATRHGDQLKLTTQRQRADGSTSAPASFTGQRIPPLPPAPDLSKVRFGEPIGLFNGKDLTGWRVMGSPNGWRAQDGVLVNDAPQEPGRRKAYANLRTEREFEDFNLQIETRVPPNGNSGIYLRGIYEVQVADSYGKPPSAHGMGAIYSRITPTENPAKPAGQWQSFDITLVDRHVTVILNGRKIIDNQPLLGCTGGALWSDQFRPGPIYLQGDHTSIEYRNMVLRPVVR